MGRRGPAPTPTAVLKARGSWRGNINKSEPKPPPGAPTKPDWLTKPASAAWDQLLAQLAPLGLATVIDGNALARYCDALVRWKQAAAALDEMGQTYCTEQGMELPRPEVGIYQKLAVLLGKIEAEFGLTPASRSRIQVKLTDEGEAKRDGPAATEEAPPVLRIAG